ncbi:hypothetical protein BCR34DRAFT_620845 [Clohesyomyces aquaticus]|uniref:Uncharacterized protein n=1 Tax=Clohesyomyces aquaticus TaxID=1231657 RepID=A0A1Y2ABC3_9PLEO|nr:hypothetical protein BCR34DRAFT_620845 [Clohesyomyces aquaticus]
MSAQNRNSGVRNLRAMFETQSAASSPEPRNRSPANTDDRPVSTNKIRASFVAVGPSTPVAKDKDAGASKGTGDDVNSTTAQHREGLSIGNETSEETVAELKKAVTEEKEERKKSDTVAETVPEQAVASRESSQPAPPIRESSPEEMPNLGSIMKGADFPEPQAAKEEEPQVEEPHLEEPHVEEPQVEEPEAQAPAIEPEVPKVEEPEAQAPIEPEVEEPAPPSVEPVTPKEEEPKQEEVKVPEPIAQVPEPEPAKEEELQVEEHVAEVEPQPEPESEPKPTVAAEPVAAEPKKTPADNQDKPVSGAQEEVSLKLADPKDEVTVSGGEALPPPTEKLPSADTSKVAPAAIAKKSPAPSKEPAKAHPPAQASKAHPPATTSKTHASATTSKAHPPAAAAKSHPPAAATKSHAPAPAPAAKSSRSSLRPSAASTTTAATASAPAKAKTPVAEQKKPIAPKTTAPPPKDSTKTSPGGFKKPRPKSPTRPVRLPSHLTAPTASSAAKHDEEAASKLGRKPSTTARPSAAKTAPPARNQHSRASLAPSTAPAKRPDSRASTRGAPDEGFLARMMRPTAASAKKTLEKPASPPRKGASGKAPVKAKSGQEGAIAKGKKKVEEVATKAKEALATNGHGSSSQQEENSGRADSEAPNGATGETQNEDAQPERESTPSEQVESSAVELQTPNFGEGQAIR